MRWICACTILLLIVRRATEESRGCVGIGILVGQGVVFALVLLLAIPTTRRRRVRSAKVSGAEGSVAEDGGSDE